MAEAIDFAEKAREIEALAALTENPLLKMTLSILARDYWALAKQENNAAKAQQVEDQLELGLAFQDGGILR
jgi:hypothetical protein